MSFGKEGLQKIRWIPYTNDQAKILFQYIAIPIFSLFLGICLSRYTDLLFLREQAKTHFSLPFSYCVTLSQVAHEVFFYSLSDLACVLLSALSTFSLLNYFTSDLILAYQGMNLGFTIALLLKLAPTCHNGELILLALLRVWLLICFVIYTYKLTAYSYEFKKMTYQGRTAFSSKTLGLLLLSTMIMCGMIIASNTLYCGLIFLI